MESKQFSDISAMFSAKPQSRVILFDLGFSELLHIRALVRTHFVFANLPPFHIVNIFGPARVDEAQRCVCTCVSP